MAVRFDNTADSLSRTTNLPTITSFTMMAWIQLVVDTNAFTSFLVIGDSTTLNIHYLGTNGTGTVLNFSNPNGDVAGATLTLGQWYHVAMTVAGTGAGQALSYLDGALALTQDGSTSVTTEALYLGNNSFGENLNGRMAAVKIYSAVLTATEIAIEMRQYAPVRWTNLNAWYPLLDTATDQDDFSGNGNALTVGGTLATEEGPPIPWQRYKNRRGSSAEAAQGWGHLLGSSRNRLVYVSR